MTKRCKHEWVYCWGANETGQTVRRFECTYQYALESVLARFVRPIAMITCRACELELSIGHSNDEPDAVQLEMRAAELDLWHTVDGMEEFDLESVEMTVGEYNGWQKHISTEWLRVTDEQMAGYLARELTTHDVSAIRDSNAWAWDISRPIAEQLAETLRADAMVEVIVSAACEPGVDFAAADLWQVDDHGRFVDQSSAACIARDPELQAIAASEVTQEHEDAFAASGGYRVFRDALIRDQAPAVPPIPEHPPDPACTCDATAPDAATAIALGWTLSEGKWRCPFWAADVDGVVA